MEKSVYIKSRKMSNDFNDLQRHFLTQDVVVGLGKSTRCSGNLNYQIYLNYQIKFYFGLLKYIFQYRTRWFFWVGLNIILHLIPEPVWTHLMYFRIKCWIVFCLSSVFKKLAIFWPTCLFLFFLSQCFLLSFLLEI